VALRARACLRLLSPDLDRPGVAVPRTSGLVSPDYTAF